jgi:hypothetical protein
MHQLTFQLAPAIATGTTPSDLILADLNGDNRLDLAVANGGSSSISVSLGNGTGGFGAKTDYAAGAAPSAIVAGDFDGDGDRDLATTNFGSDDISVWRNNGAGVFTGLTAVNFGEGFGVPTDLVVGNFNGDANLDIAVSYSGTSNVAIGYGNGAGSFVLGVGIGTGAAPAGLVTGRFNADALDDLAVVNFQAPAGEASTVTIALATPTIDPSPFTVSSQFTVGVDARPNSIAVGDFNSDGKVDLVTANEGTNTVSVAIGNGLGGFATGVLYTVGDLPNGVTVADFNADGKLDIATANSTSNNLSILLGNGLGVFTHNTTLTVNRPVGIATGDLNGDGKLDIVSGNETANTASILLSGSERSEIYWRNPNTNVSVVWNQENIRQLVDGRLLTYGKGIGDARVGTAVRYDQSWRLLDTVDLNGDGVEDLVYTRDATDTANGEIRVLTIGQFNGQAATVEADRELTFASPKFGTLNGQAAQHLPKWALVGVKDMTGDGQADFVFYSRGLDRTVIWTTNKSGQIVDGGYVEHLDGRTGGQETGAPDDWRVQAMGDFTGDGKVDFLWRNTQDVVVLWEMNGVQLNATRVNSTTGAQAGSGILPSLASRFQVKGVGDFNNDGVDDVLWRDQAGNESRIWTFGTNGRPTSVTLQAATTQWEVGGVADMNRDGTDDVVWRNNLDNNVVIWNIQNAAFSLPGSGLVLNYLPGGNQQVINPGADFKIDAVTGLALVAPLPG